MVYSIPSENMFLLREKVGKIQRKAEKFGNVITFKEGNHYFKSEKIDGYSIEIEYVDVEVEGTAKENGWEFVAEIRHTGLGLNMVYNVSDMEIPARYKTAECFCEHCQTHRERSSTFLLYNAERKEFKQVGRNCLMDFTHGLSAERVASMLEYRKCIEEAAKSDVGLGNVIL